VSRYLRDYKAEMLRCKIPEGLQVTSFSRVATDELQAIIHGIQQQNLRWEAFQEKLKTTFAVGDSSKATWRGFEDWVETPDKGLKVVAVFSAFKTRFGRLSARDQALLGLDKVIMFLQAVDIQDRKDLGLLLEDTTTESGLSETWENVRDIVVRYTKRGRADGLPTKERGFRNRLRNRGPDQKSSNRGLERLWLREESKHPRWSNY
jgi:hypothetical protein